MISPPDQGYDFSLYLSGGFLSENCPMAGFLVGIAQVLLLAGFLMGIARVSKCSKTMRLCLGNSFLYSTVRSASRLIKNLPVPLGTLVRKRVRLKPAASLHHLLHLVKLDLVLCIIVTKLGNVPRPVSFFQCIGATISIVCSCAALSCIHQVV